jgi:hypothetical protein
MKRTREWYYAKWTANIGVLDSLTEEAMARRMAINDSIGEQAMIDAARSRKSKLELLRDSLHERIDSRVEILVHGMTSYDERESIRSLLDADNKKCSDIEEELQEIYDVTGLGYED